MKQKGKIGIFMHGQAGDVSTATSVFKYKDLLWKDKDIVWFINNPNSDLLKFNPYVEIRPFAFGWGLPHRCLPDGEDNRNAKKLKQPVWQDWSILKNKNNCLNQEFKTNFELTADLEEAYFPAPYDLTVEQRHGIDYPNCSRKVFGIDPSWEWHPVLFFSDEEKKMAEDFCRALLYQRTVLMETFAGSGQSMLSDRMVKNTMSKIRERWGDTNFIFVSHKYLNGDEAFPADLFTQKGVVSASHFTVRQCSLLNNHADLMVGVSSGISCTTSCWGNKKTPKLQYCGSFICSTVSLALGDIQTIYGDDNPVIEKNELLFENKLIVMLE